MAIDPQILKHREWLGLLQPVGLVVSPLALTRAQAIVDISRPIELQTRLQELDSLDLPTFTQQILDWEAADLVPHGDLPDSMTLALPEYGELLQPTYGVKDPDSQEWIVLVQVVADGQELDKSPVNSSWNATVQERFERLLRSSQIPTGILWNGEALRLVYAPRGESSGHLTFPLAAMGEVAGRPILWALDTLLNAQRMFNGSSDRRLPQILANSRDYQSAVSEQCLYGVDKNPFAVNLAKLSLWLVTLSRDLPFTFLDHALKCGDSLVGRTRREINAFGRTESPLAGSPIGEELNKQILAVKLWRSEIQVQDTRSDAQALEKAQMWQSAELALAGVRLRGDVSIAAFFDGVGMKAQEKKDLLLDYAGMVQLQPERMVDVSARLRERVVPFNWEIEFPEVFDRENGGFDAIVGNPPFAGKNTTTNGNAEGYPDWLKDIYAESHGNSDLVAFFFRRSFDLLRTGGTMGLIATNTIAQGDTRSTGLRFICNNRGLIYNATRRYKWPGLAAVVVSLVYIMKIK
jgi:hypothetical protein